MKYLLMFVLIIATGKSFSQIHSQKSILIITAKEAYQHVGEKVDVRDSLYSGKIINDYTIVFLVGEKTNTPRLTMIYILRNSRGITSALDPEVIKKLQRTKIYIYGIITGTTQAPQIIVDGSAGHMGFPRGKM
jgi:hypothetical protein